MTKKHYEEIAKAIRSSYNYTVQCNRLADYFATDNPKFNRERFLLACGIKQ